MFSTCIPLPQITQDLSNLPPEELKPNVTEGDICWIKWVVFTVSLGQGPEKWKGAKAAVAFLNGGVGILSSLLSTSCCIHSKLVFKAVLFSAEHSHGGRGSSFQLQRNRLWLGASTCISPCGKVWSRGFRSSHTLQTWLQKQAEDPSGILVLYHLC